ncbi:MAG TPA: sodium-dependent bicarbonate transport family permease [Pirellulales bacterium]|nr:sodium-dependent bicarbonate transport family permease [Pirellulales bacterium]
MSEILASFWDNFRHNLFKPLLLFFYMGFLVPILKVPFEFPYQVYQGLTIFLLVSIGWKGGEELASLKPEELKQALGFMLVGFITNFIIGIIAYVVLRGGTRLRKIDAATVAGYYGSDSAGTFATAVGVLGTVGLSFAAYMPVMLAIMEIPGCLVALFLVSKLRLTGMDPLGNMPGEAGYNPLAAKAAPLAGDHGAHAAAAHGDHAGLSAATLEKDRKQFLGFINFKLLHELFLNQGLYLLLGGILIGFVSRFQGEKVSAVDDPLFISLFQGLLCLFLLEMGITACQRLRDLKMGGWPFVAFAIIAPNVFATFGMTVAHVYSAAIGEPFEIGTYVIFAVLCGAASYIAVPAIQRLAIPEASPTLPLAASLGCTFSYNVTIGIPVYIEIAKLLMKAFPVGGEALSS